MSYFRPNTDRQPTQAKNKKQLAEEMGLSMRTFQRRLDDADLDVPRGLIGPDQQVEIFERLGWRNLAQSGMK
jgi:hypothetical protein